MALGHVFGNVNIAGSSGVVLGDAILHIGQQVPADPKKILLESLIFDRWDSRRSNIPTARHRTCQWIFAHETFKAWLDPGRVSQHGSFLWLWGNPGSGKSTIMKEAIAWTRRKMPPQHLVLSYFFNARSSFTLEKSSLGLYRSLTYQLLTAFPNGLALLADMFSSKVRDGEMIEQWTVTEVHNFLLELVVTMRLPPLTLFIDALDEGPEDDVRDMVDDLAHLIQRSRSGGNQIAICYSSRHYPRITSGRCVSIVLEKQHEHLRDIELYVYEKLRGSSDSKWGDLRQQVLDRSNGVFLWVVLVVSMLNKLYDQCCSIKTRTKKLEQVPHDLHEIFSNIISQQTEDIQESVCLFRWMLFSLRPLTPLELCEAVKIAHISEDDTDSSAAEDDHETQTENLAQRRISHYSRGLVELSTTSLTSTPQFIHETARDFLLGKNVANKGTTRTKAGQTIPIPFQADVCHAAIAEDCLRYLATLATKPSSLLDGTNSSVLAKYAARYWWQHVQAANDMISKNVIDLATDMCLVEGRLMVWVRHHSTEERWRSNDHIYDPWNDDDGDVLYPPLYYAAIIGFTELVNVLLDRGENVNAVGGYHGNALQAACTFGYQKIVQVLLDNGADVNNQGGRHSNALQAASENGHEKIVQMLLASGANVNAVGEGDSNALQTASEHGYEGIVQLLLDSGAHINARGEQHSNALQAASNNGHEKIVQILLDRGADINAQGGDYGNALQAASDNGYERIVQMLLDRGVDLNARGGIHDNALQTASENGYEKIVLMLLDRKVDVNARGGLSGNALQKASQYGHQKVVQLLLDRGADVNAEGGVYGNALEAATAFGHDEVVQILLEHGAKSTERPIICMKDTTDQ